MYLFNIIVSHNFMEFPRVKKEVTQIIKEMGDSEAEVEKTSTSGVARIKTKLNARDVIRKVRSLYNSNSERVRYSKKWIPVDNWSDSTIDQMRGVVNEIKKKISPDETWAMQVDKHRYFPLHTEEIIKQLSEQIFEKVDLQNPDKILRIDILGSQTAISVLCPDDIFSLSGRNTDSI